MSNAGLRQRQIVETRTALLNAGRDVFGKQGYWAPTANQIAAHAELTRGALYHHFPEGKPDLFRAVFDTIQSETYESVVAARDAGADWRAQIGSYLTAFAHPETSRIVLIDAPAVLGAEAWRTADEVLWMGLIADGIAAGPMDNALRQRDAHILGRLLFGAFGEAALAVAAADDPHRVAEETIATIAAMLGLD